MLERSGRSLPAQRPRGVEQDLAHHLQLAGLHVERFVAGQSELLDLGALPSFRSARLRLAGNELGN